MEKKRQTTLYHITSRSEIVKALASGTYVPSAYSSEGFVHCSYLHQVVKVANRFYGGQNDQVLIEIDKDQVNAAVVDENLEGGDELFPHVYGRIPGGAITAVHDFPPGPDGHFTLPETINA